MHGTTRIIAATKGTKVLVLLYYVGAWLELILCRRWYL